MLHVKRYTHKHMQQSNSVERSLHIPRPHCTQHTDCGDCPDAQFEFISRVLCRLLKAGSTGQIELERTRLDASLPLD